MQCATSSLVGPSVNFKRLPSSKQKETTDQLVHFSRTGDANEQASGSLFLILHLIWGEIVFAEQ